ncbi:MAG: Mrp/NBP35 family ATP-binding protein [Spirochaetes bacterium]|nr:Mrp/NBP35 family ATP-binding protein [Spirochaetota bacterium]
MTENENLKLDNIKKRLIVMSGKGGVGKSTVAVNLAVELAERGFKVGLLDVDVHGPSVPKLLGLENQKVGTSPSGMVKPVFYSENLKVISVGFLIDREDSAVIWRGPMKYNAIKQFLTDVDWENLDYLVIDSPPGTGDEPLAVCQLLSGNSEAVIVTTPQDLALSDVLKSITFCEKVGIPVKGIIENMSGLECPHCGKNIDLFKSGGGRKISEDRGKTYLGEIPIEMDMVHRGDDGRPFMKKSSKDKSKAAKAFSAIVDVIIS